MKKKLLLVNPVNPKFLKFGLRQEGRIPPLALGIIAALTPNDWDVKIVDENFGTLDHIEADLVGITAFTCTVTRAYEIADIFRKKGVITVMGGIHASMLPEEALQHVDVVVIGEVENVWKEIITDFEARTLQKIYKGEFEDLINMPIPRWDLFHPEYLGAIQTTRGCPMNCAFCSVTAFNGNRYRYRPIEEVLDELERIPKKFVYFLDDNIVGHGKESEERAINLFRGIVDRGIKKWWAGSASMNFAENEDVLKSAAESGCHFIMLGVEAETSDALREMNKNLNLRVIKGSYEEVFRRIHKHGIAIHGFFMYGLDLDTPETLRKRTDYIKKSGVDSIGASIACPFPGTRLYEKMREEERLRYTDFPDAWAHYHFSEVAQKPKLMEPHILEDIMWKTYNQLYSRRAILYRFIRTLYVTRNPISTLMAFKYNKRMRTLNLRLFNN